MATNLLSHSRKKWRALGYYVEGTESIIRLPGGITQRSDLFGFADLVAVPLVAPEFGGWVYLQVTSRSNTSARLRKIQTGTTGKGQWEVPIRTIVQAILDHGDRVIVEGWDLHKNRWRDQEREITLDMREG